MNEASRAAAAFARVLDVVDEVIADDTSSAGPIAAGVEDTSLSGLGVGPEEPVEFHQMVVATEPDGDVADVMDEDCAPTVRRRR